jgi:hypothetical protein
MVNGTKNRTVSPLLFWLTVTVCCIVLISLATVCIASFVHKWRDKEMILAIKSIAGAGELNEDGLVSVVFTKPVSDHEFEEVAALARGRLFAVIADGTKITDASLACLQGEGRLKGITLGGTGITDSGLSNLAELPSLEVLTLRDTSIDGHGLPALAGLPKLHGLDLTRTRIGDAGLRYVVQLRHLRGLHLGCLPVSINGLRSLSALNDLRNLDLRSTGITDAQVSDIMKFLPANCRVTTTGSSGACPGPTTLSTGTEKLP